MWPRSPPDAVPGASGKPGIGEVLPNDSGASRCKPARSRVKIFFPSKAVALVRAGWQGAATAQAGPAAACRHLPDTLDRLA